MITPLDIENKKFRKKPLGYCQEEVDEFLDTLNESYENLYKENIELKDKVSALNEAIQHYKTIEDTLQNTLLMAQSAGDEVKRNASEKAENIIRDAEISSKKIIDEANQQVIKITCEYENTKKDMILYKTRMQNLVMSQIELLKYSSSSSIYLS
jgi:cell division initiation protein